MPRNSHWRCRVVDDPLAPDDLSVSAELNGNCACKRRAYGTLSQNLSADQQPADRDEPIPTGFWFTRRCNGPVQGRHRRRTASTCLWLAGRLSWTAGSALMIGVISSESGAGDQTAKKVLQHLLLHRLRSGAQNEGIEARILASSPLLEAFGNAKTSMNNNSSRYGKFLMLQFDTSGTLSGAHIKTYLLEKTRVVQQGNLERGYHIGYMLCQSTELAPLLGLPAARELQYLGQTGCLVSRDGMTRRSSPIAWLRRTTWAWRASRATSSGASSPPCCYWASSTLARPTPPSRRSSTWPRCRSSARSSKSTPRPCAAASQSR